MNLRKFRWSKVYESQEEELINLFRARNINAEHWEAEAFDTSESRCFDQEITIWCAEGSFTFRSGDKAMSMQPGDALHVSAGIAFRIDAGMSGYICYKS
jgi:hypothetical protein